MEACVGAHHLRRRLQALGHDARLMPAKNVRLYSKGQKNDFRGAEAIAEAAQRPTMKFVAIKSVDQLDLQALLERGIAVRQGPRFLRIELPRLLAGPCEVLSPRMARIIEGRASDWRHLDERIEGLSGEIEAMARQDVGCELRASPSAVPDRWSRVQRALPPCSRAASSACIQTAVLALQQASRLATATNLPSVVLLRREGKGNS